MCPPILTYIYESESKNTHKTTHFDTYIFYITYILTSSSLPAANPESENHHPLQNVKPKRVFYSPPYEVRRRLFHKDSRSTVAHGSSPSLMVGQRPMVSSSLFVHKLNLQTASSENYTIVLVIIIPFLRNLQ